MKTSPAWPPVCGTPRFHHACDISQQIAAARLDPAKFIGLCLTDPQGNPVELAPIHEEMQAFLSNHRMALIELPRDHGKSFQLCGRLLWELGRNPGLRVKVVCATEAVAAERSRFLRDAIAKNPHLRLVFPRLRAATPWDRRGVRDPTTRRGYWSKCRRVRSRSGEYRDSRRSADL